jgi:hypothetical protein
VADYEPFRLACRRKIRKIYLRDSGRRCGELGIKNVVH